MNNGSASVGGILSLDHALAAAALDKTKLSVFAILEAAEQMLVGAAVVKQHRNGFRAAILHSQVLRTLDGNRLLGIDGRREGKRTPQIFRT